MSMVESGSGNDCQGTGMIQVATGKYEACEGCESCRRQRIAVAQAKEAAEKAASASIGGLLEEINPSRVRGARTGSEPAHEMTMKERTDRLDRTVELAMALGRAEKEIEQLKASNEWLLKQLRAKEPWASADAWEKSDKEALTRPMIDLDWSVRTLTVIQRKLSDRATVADAVAIPPAEWLKVHRCGMLILREMDKMFKGLGVEWPGEWPRQ